MGLCACAAGTDFEPVGYTAGDGVPLPADEGGADEAGDESGGDDGDDGDGGPLYDAGGPPPPDGGGCDCAAGLDLIHLVSGDDALWRFDPRDLSFTELGPLGCTEHTASSPFSMAISRNGRAFVSFWDGDVLDVDVSDPSVCTDPGFEPQQGYFRHFGMAFVSESGDAGGCDDLYAHSIDVNEAVEAPGAGKLGRLWVRGSVIDPVAAIDFSRGELTGTDDGRLYAFAGTEPAKLIEYDPDTGEELDAMVLQGLELTSAFAFAFWGGDFYFFTEGEGFGSHSMVTWLDYDGSDGGGLTTVAQAPMRVFGAGVSTCAPYEPEG